MVIFQYNDYESLAETVAELADDDGNYYVPSHCVVSYDILIANSGFTLMMYKISLCKVATGAIHGICIIQFSGSFTSSNTLSTSASSNFDLSSTTYSDIPTPSVQVRTAVIAKSNNTCIGYTTWSLTTSKMLSVITTTTGAQESIGTLTYYYFS